jgi:two-component system sensor histidine kinase HydH
MGSVRMKWFSWAVAMALLSVLALGATVIASAHALHDASTMVVRGEGDVVLASVASDLANEPDPFTPEALNRVLAAHAPDGLRYVAVVDREHTIVGAGTATMTGAPVRPGQPAIEGRRVRAVGPLFHDREHLRGFGRPPMMLLVTELEPPMVVTLEHGQIRIAVVAGIAGIVLLAFAVAWSRSAARLRSLEAKTAHNERLVALGSMSSVMAHELRNPLASLKGHAQLLAEDLEGKQKTKAERVGKEAERLEVLTTSLLDFVRDGPISRAPIAPDALMDLALRDLERTRVDVAVESKTDIEVDAERLARALHNLIDNALKADEKGRVSVAVTADAITVRDHGPGIAASDKARIFEPFVTTRVRGTGLGLAVARRIAEQHGGSLEGDTHPDGGALFTLKLGS